MIYGVRSSIKNLQKVGGRGEGTIHLILIAQNQRPKHQTQTVCQTLIYRHRLIVVHQAMINAGRERDPEETEIDAEKRGIADATKDADDVIRDRNVNQKGCITT